MAENQESKAQPGIDSTLESAEKGLDKLASDGFKLFGLLQIGGDADMKKKVDNIGIDKAIGAFATPYKAMFGIHREFRRLGARLESAVEYRRRFAAEEYLSGRGPWARGLIYGNSDRLIDKNAYAGEVIKRNGILQSRQDAYRRREHDLLQRIDAAQTAGNLAQVRTLRGEMRDLNRRNRNPELSRPFAAGGGDELDTQNNALLAANAAMQTANVGGALPGTRMLKRRRIENAVKITEKKKTLAKAITDTQSGPRRQENYRKRLFNLEADLNAEKAKPIAQRDIKRIVTIERQIQNLQGVISGPETIINDALLGTSNFKVIRGRAAA